MWKLDNVYRFNYTLQDFNLQSIVRAYYGFEAGCS